MAERKKSNQYKRSNWKTKKGKQATRKKAKREKAKELQPDADGFFHTGIYRKRVVREKATKLPEFQELVRLFLPPAATDMVRSLQVRIANFIRPHITEVKSTDRRDYPGGVRIHYIDLGNGEGVKGFTVDEDAKPVIYDGIDALVQCRALIPAIERGDTDSATRFAFRLGRLEERMYVRGFEHAAKVGRERREHGRTKLRTGRRRQAAEERAAKHKRAKRALAKTKYRHPSLADQEKLMIRMAARYEGTHLTTFRRWLYEYRPPSETD